MFKGIRFTDRARKVMALANQEARHYRHDHIDTGDILLGIVKEGQGVACVVLKNLRVGLGDICLKFEQRIEKGRDIASMGKLPQTPFAKKVIEYAIEESRNMGHNYVGTEHLLLGLLRRYRYKKDGTKKYQYTTTTANKILRSLDVTFKKVRAEVNKILGAGGISMRHADVPEEKKQRFTKCKIFKLDEEEITEFLKTKEFVQATQSSSTRITIFYRDRE